MSVERQVAYAIRSKSLCLLLGSGFSKHLCEDMPSWEELIKECIKSLPPEKRKALQTLFFMGPRPMALEDCAQILEAQFNGQGMSLKEKISAYISECSKKFDPSRVNQTVRFLKGVKPLRVVTTNYDLLVEKCLGKDAFQSYCPGKSILHESDDRRIYHIHGSIDEPNCIVATTRDYYSFINNPTYFGLKTETLLYENTILVIGYSASDTNLRAILDSYKGKIAGSGSVATIFMLTHSEVSEFVSDQLKDTFGIVTHHVPDLESFFRSVIVHFGNTEELFARVRKGFPKVIGDNSQFKEDFWENLGSMGLILHSAQKNGIGLSNANFLKLLEVGLKVKRSLALQNGGWAHYAHLASWLVDIGSWCDVRGTGFWDTYLEAIRFSLKSSGRNTGYSWQAFDVWENGWGRIRRPNRDGLLSEISGADLQPEVLEFLR